MRTLKIAVLANGEIRLDGQAVSLEALGQAMAEAGNADTVVWYYREQSTGDPPHAVTEVLRLVTDHKLPVKFSSKADFSDTVAPADVLDRLFGALRKAAAQNQIAILRPNGQVLLLPAIPKDQVPAARLAAVEKLLSSKVKRNVAVLGDTAWTMADSPDLARANGAIPFFGMLMGLSSIGHAVWIFDASAGQVLTVACRDADVLIVDGDRVTGLQQGWQENAAQEMRRRQIFIHDRASYQLRKA